MKSIKQILKSACGIVIISSIYGFILAFAYALKWRSKPLKNPSKKILIIGTFHNPNWFRSHIRPIAGCGYGEVILICDEKVDEVDSVRYEIPPRIMSMLLSRAGAKFFWAIYCSMKYRPDIYMGYHIFPAGISALLLGSLFARPVCYQVTSGPRELEGGGWNTENRVLSLLGKHSRLVEMLSHRIVKQIDLVIVRGNRAQKYIRELGFRNQLEIITGSVEVPDRNPDFIERDIDLVFVGRLSEIKRPDRFVSIVEQVVTQHPKVRAVMVGNGPELSNLQAMVKEKKLQHNLELLGQRSDVPDILKQSRVFVLTSRSEGLSIAMLEAMISGVVPVVSDVGDLRDVVEDGRNGFVVAQEDLTRFSAEITGLLASREHWENVSQAAFNGVVGYSGITVIKQKWLDGLNRLVKTGDVYD